MSRSTPPPTVTLLSTDNHRLTIPRQTLLHASPHFRKLLTLRTRHHPPLLPLNLHSTTLQNLLHYIRTSTSPLFTPQTPADIIALANLADAADRVGMPRLHAMCCRRLVAAVRELPCLACHVLAAVHAAALTEVDEGEVFEVINKYPGVALQVPDVRAGDGTMGMVSDTPLLQLDAASLHGLVGGLCRGGWREYAVQVLYCWATGGRVMDGMGPGVVERWRWEVARAVARGVGLEGMEEGFLRRFVRGCGLWDVEDVDRFTGGSDGSEGSDSSGSGEVEMLGRRLGGVGIERVEDYEWGGSGSEDDVGDGSGSGSDDGRRYGGYEDERDEGGFDEEFEEEGGSEDGRGGVKDDECEMDDIVHRFEYDGEEEGRYGRGDRERCWDEYDCEDDQADGVYDCGRDNGAEYDDGASKIDHSHDQHDNGVDNDSDVGDDYDASDDSDGGDGYRCDDYDDDDCNDDDCDDYDDDFDDY